LLSKYEQAFSENEVADPADPLGKFPSIIHPPTQARISQNILSPFIQQLIPHIYAH
jgi:hypothetical protein